MRTSALKATIMATLTKLEFTAEDPVVARVNRIICGVLLYDKLKKLVNEDPKSSNKLNDKANSYVTGIKNIAESLERTYVSYKSIKSYILKHDITTFMDVNEYHIDKILVIYSDKKKVQPFSLVDYSDSMYYVASATASQSEFLYYVHKNIICPIVEYCIKYEGSTITDVAVENAIDSCPGKAINFSVRNVPLNKLITIITTNKLRLPNIYSVEIHDKLWVQITILERK